MAVTPLDVLWNPESISLPRGGAVYFAVTELADHAHGGGVVQRQWAAYQ